MTIRKLFPTAAALALPTSAAAAESATPVYFFGTLERTPRGKRRPATLSWLRPLRVAELAHAWN